MEIREKDIEKFNTASPHASVLPIFVGNRAQTYRSSFANLAQKQLSVALYRISLLFALRSHEGIIFLGAV
jgi:hypothetical protein